MKIYITIILVVCSIFVSCRDNVTTEGVSTSRSEFRNAVRLGQVSLVKQYLDDGYDINELGDGGENALHEGVLHYEVAKLLIDRGISLDNSHQYSGQTPLHIASIAGNVDPEVVKLLLVSGLNPLHKDVHGRTPLNYATQSAKQFADEGYSKKVGLMSEHLKKK